MTIGGSQLLHRLVGLVLAVAMPVCCCTTSLFGDAVLGEDFGGDFGISYDSQPLSAPEKRFQAGPWGENLRVHGM